MYTGTTLPVLSALLLFMTGALGYPYSWLWIPCGCVTGFCSGKLYALGVAQQYHEKAERDAG
jgi:hypothetical protein